MIPEIYGPDSLCAGEGDTVILDISTLYILTASQNTGDSLSMSWNGGIRHARFTLTDSGKNPKARFYRIVPPGTERGMAYTFSVRVSDNHCPRVALS